MSYLEKVKSVIQEEAQTLIQVSESLGDSVEDALKILSDCHGKIVLSGVGKSGHIARKISSTLSSLGSPSIYVHPSECSHGDLGIIDEKDILWVLSNSGNSPELRDLIAYSSRKNIPLIAMTGNLESELAKASSILLHVQVEQEAGAMGLAPTSSTTASLAVGDAIAVCLLEMRGFTEDNFAEFHPGGTIGKRLLTKVEDVMHKGDSFPLVEENAAMREVLSKMTSKEVRGVAGVVDAQGDLIGVVTDGDIRRRLEKSKDPLAEKAKDLMSNNPKSIYKGELAQKALFMMEQFSIQTLFVLDERDKKPVGILHFQDLLKAKVR